MWDNDRRVLVFDHDGSMTTWHHRTCVKNGYRNCKKSAACYWCFASEDFKGEWLFPCVIDNETCSYWRVVKLLSSVVESLPPFVSSMTRRTLFSLVHLSDSRHSSQGRGASFALFICASFWIVHHNPSPPQMTWRENSAQTLPPRTRCSIACRFVGFTRKRHETSSVSFIFLFVNLTTVAQTCFSVSFFYFYF